jgi:hypothetical protein
MDPNKIGHLSGTKSSDLPVISKNKRPTMLNSLLEKIYRLRWLIWPVLGMLLLTAGLGLFEFRAARSQTNIEHQVATFSFGRDGGSSLLLNQDLGLYVFGPEQLAHKLADDLKETLKADTHIRDVQLQRGALARVDGSVLVVRIVKSDTLWLPVHSRARVEITFAYASDGSVDWMDDEVIHSEGGRFTVRANGRIELDDRSYGLISRPGYHSHLSNRIGSRLVQAVGTVWANTE